MFSLENSISKFAKIVPTFLLSESDIADDTENVNYGNCNIFHDSWSVAQICAEILQFADKLK